VTENLRRLVHDRLSHDGHLDADWAPLVLDAFEAPPTTGEIHGRAYLKALTVQGFRGIGPEQTLPLEPGPGLTVVVGRNGSGKSSFAEALEVLFTGNSLRWAGRSKIWQEGWRNLHQSHPASISAQVLLDGQRETTISCAWDAAAAFDTKTTGVQTVGKPRTTLDALGWKTALTSYRPFLSYNELSSLLDEGPSKLYDALSLVLGLDALVQAQDRLAQRRTDRTKALAAADATRKSLVDQLRALLARQDDARAATCLAALTSESWGLADVESVLSSQATPAADQDLGLLTRASTLEAPNRDHVTTAARSLSEAKALVDATVGTDADRSRELAALLTTALAFHSTHHEKDCPVCGQPATLTESWAETTRREIARLQKDASSSAAAHTAMDRARRQAATLFSAPPALLGQLATLTTVDLDGLTSARDAWTTWAAGASLTDATMMAAHLESQYDALAQGVETVKRSAAAEVRRREDLWRPIAVPLADWLGRALEARADAEEVPRIKSAEAWLKDAAEAMRNDRFAPIAEKAMAAWAQLRQQSNVSLGRIELSGGKTNRRVVLDVTVDDVPGAALGVMSQGELHSLALSLFLPRATLDESPFRFVVIDDPVQSMDPARVDGLARALEETARTRQVIVFTHDDRLPEAVRRLAVKATILGITRRPQSAVEVRTVLSPVRAHIEDAWALVRTDELPDVVKRQIVPGFCRSAIEAACIRLVRRRQLTAGRTHAEVEEAIAACRTTTVLASLALYDDAERGGEVMARLNKFGGWAGDVFKQCKEGAHAAATGDLELMVRDAERLADKMLELR
jgi:energy-coupling factor transporter ATP-binding protein EcfA2